MDKILESQIMEHKWHEFLYGEPTDKRTQFLKSMESHYPIIYGKDVPMGIYLETYGFKSENKSDLTNQEKLMLDITAREYLKNLIAYQIMTHIENDSDIMEEVEEPIIKFLNEFCYGRKELLSSIKNYLNELKETINICRENYNSILSSGNPHPQFLDYLGFLNIEKFGKGLKKILNNNGQFNIIIDHKNEIAEQSTKAIMSIVNSRCAGTICMKVATTKNDWTTYTDLNGNFSEYIHDYSTVDLEDKKILKNEIMNN